MDESLQLTNETTTDTLLELGSALDVSLNAWSEELCAGSNRTRAEKHGGSLSTNAEPTLGTKDPTKSLKCDAKGKSAPKKRPTGSGSQQSATPGQSSTTDVAALLKEAFSGLAVEANKGFSSLGALLKVKNDAKGDDNAPALSDSESDDHDCGSDKESEEPARKKQIKGNCE